MKKSLMQKWRVLRKLTSGKPYVFNHLIDLNPLPAARAPLRGSRAIFIHPGADPAEAASLSPTKNILREALYYQVFERFDPLRTRRAPLRGARRFFIQPDADTAGGGIVSPTKINQRKALCLQSLDR